MNVQLYNCLSILLEVQFVLLEKSNYSACFLTLAQMTEVQMKRGQKKRGEMYQQVYKYNTSSRENEVALLMAD